MAAAAVVAAAAPHLSHFSLSSSLLTSSDGKAGKSSADLPAASLSDPSPLARGSTANTAEQARKRRRDYLASQRGVEAALLQGESLVPGEGGGGGGGGGSEISSPVALPPRKKSKKVVSTSDYEEDDEDSATEDTGSLSSSSSKASKWTVAKAKSKKPQRKYDPDVPMTKEEAAAWRREQRRKRNRESAAASRQRQRDRIDELEAELEEWKAKCEQALQELKELEASVGVSLPGDAEEVFEAHPSRVWSTSEGVRATTPPPTSQGVQTVTPRASPTGREATADEDPVGALEEAMHLPQDEDDEGPEDDGSDELLPPKMISRPAQS